MRKTGLSMLEVMISVIILAITLASLGNLFVTGKRYILHARSRISAAEMGKFFLEPLQMQVDQSSWGSTTLSRNLTTLSSETFVDSGISYSGSYNVSPVDGTTLRRVVLTLGWTENAPTP
ncbi:MAG: hypothetical protein Q8N85_03045 [Candidatus Omnitrophota bacterium]|nr:hypothetical protein [Candidatus Omnitrophota bacterium]